MCVCARARFGSEGQDLESYSICSMSKNTDVKMHLFFCNQQQDFSGRDHLRNVTEIDASQNLLCCSHHSLMFAVSRNIIN